jgi:hypothetical protein
MNPGWILGLQSLLHKDQNLGKDWWSLVVQDWNLSPALAFQSVSTSNGAAQFHQHPLWQLGGWQVLSSVHCQVSVKGLLELGGRGHHHFTRRPSEPGTGSLNGKLAGEQKRVVCQNPQTVGTVSAFVPGGALTVQARELWERASEASRNSRQGEGCEFTKS